VVTGHFGRGAETLQVIDFERFGPLLRLIFGSAQGLVGAACKKYPGAETYR
jgi:hypothetical protein